MLRVHSKKIIGDVLSRKGRTLLVAAAICVGVAGTIALFTMSDALISQLEQNIQEDLLAMAQITVNAEPDEALRNADYLAALDAVPGVTMVAGGVEAQTVYFKPDASAADFEEGLINATAILDDAGQMISVFGDDAPIEPLRLQAGAFPRAGANEVVIEKRLAEQYGLSVGDPLYFRVLSPSRQPDQGGATGTVEQWTISGLVFDAYAGMLNPKQAIYAHVEDATYLVGLSGFTEFWLRFVDYPTAEAQIETVTNRIAADMPYTPIATTTEDPANSFLLQGARIAGSLLSTLAIAALVVSGFLVVNVISAIIVEQKRQIGVMKALGASRIDTIRIYTGIALVYGVLGVIPGVILGIPAGDAMAQGIGTEMNVLFDSFQVSVSSIVLGVVMGLLVPVIASLPPVLNGTRVKILDAMTDLGIDAKYGAGPLAHLIRLLPLPTTIRQGLSNVTLKKARMAFTIVTLAVAVGAFMGIFSIFGQLTSSLDLVADNYRAEIALMPIEARDPAEIEAVLHDSFADQIAVIEPGFQIAVEFDGFKSEAIAGTTGEIYAYGYDTASAHPPFDFALEHGTMITPETAGTGLILSGKLADAMDRSVGDTVIMKVPGRAMAFDIVGIADYPFDQVWMHWETLAAMSGGTVNTILRPQTYFLFTSADDLSADDVDDLISAISNRFAETGTPVMAINFVQVVDDITETYTSFQMIFQMVAMLIALVGALGLLITLSMSVFERQKEIGVMRSVGARSSAIATQFVTEGVVVGLLAWLVGLPIMLGMEIVVIDVTGFTGVLQTELTLTAILIGLIGVITLTFVASLLPALSAARKTVSDILRYG